MIVTPSVHTLPPVRPLNTDPLTALLEALDHLAALDVSLWTLKAELRVTAYYDALCSLAGTYSDTDEGARVYAEHAERLPSGTPLGKAAPEELRRYTLALYGLARDKLTPNTRSCDLDEWYEVAIEAMHTYAQPRAA